jgi:bifunctional non-homologous end joining protein LigD
MNLPFEPMLLSAATRPFDDPQWIAQVKWDGVRNLALVQAGEVRLWSRRLRERTDQYPELTGLVKACRSSRVVLDGELIVLKGGQPRFAGILEREQARRVDERWVKARPTTYMVFDLLEYGDRELYEEPIENRLELLQSLLIPDEHWQMIDSFSGSTASDLFAATTARGLEGVVLKRLGTRYTVGVRSKDWVKVKRRQRILAIVCGYTQPIGGTGGLLLGAYQDGRLLYIGRVGSGLTAPVFSLLRDSLPAAPRPFGYEPSLRDRFSGTPGPVVWTEPRLTVQVEFTEWTEEMRLRDPVFVGFSTEPPQSAVM